MTIILTKVSDTQYQIRIQNIAKQLRWSFSAKIENGFPERATSQILDWVLNNLLSIPRCENCPNAEFYCSVFSCIRTEYGDLRSKSPYSVRIQKNTDQKKLRIWTFFTHCTKRLGKCFFAFCSIVHKVVQFCCQMFTILSEVDRKMSHIHFFNCQRSNFKRFKKGKKNT